MSFGTNTGALAPSSGLSVTGDNSYVLTPFLNVNTDYQDGSGKQQILVSSQLTTTGEVFWMNTYSLTGNDISLADGGLSPDSLKYYILGKQITST